MAQKKTAVKNATKNQAKRASRRRKNRQRGANFLDPVSARYLECAAGGQPAATGVPDGDGRLSVVKNVRDFVTISPDSNGSIEFVLGVTPHGHMTIIRGTAPRATTVYSVNTTTGVLTATQQSITSYYAGVVGPTGGIVPVNPSTVLDVSSDMASQWRVVNSQWRINFTGSALANGGNCVVTPWSPQSFTRNTAWTSAGTAGTLPVVQAPRLGINANPSSLVRPAHKPLCITLIPRDTQYQNSALLAEDMGMTGPTCTVSRPHATPFPSNTVYLGMAAHQSCRMYHVRYSGLDSSASITVDNMTCVQYLVDPDGIEGPIARPSEVGNQSFLNQFLSSISNHPAIGETVQEVKNGILSAAGRAIAYGARSLFRAGPLALM